jgi:hypothetical protein
MIDGIGVVALTGATAFTAGGPAGLALAAGGAAALVAVVLGARAAWRAAPATWRAARARAPPAPIREHQPFRTGRARVRVRALNIGKLERRPGYSFIVRTRARPEATPKPPPQPTPQPGQSQPGKAFLWPSEDHHRHVPISAEVGVSAEAVRRIDLTAGGARAPPGLYSDGSMAHVAGAVDRAHPALLAEVHAALTKRARAHRALRAAIDAAGDGLPVSIDARARRVLDSRPIGPRRPMRATRDMRRRAVATQRLRAGRRAAEDHLTALIAAGGEPRKALAGFQSRREVAGWTEPNLPADGVGPTGPPAGSAGPTPTAPHGTGPGPRPAPAHASDVGSGPPKAPLESRVAGPASPRARPDGKRSAAATARLPHRVAHSLARRIRALARGPPAPPIASRPASATQTRLRRRRS